MWAKVDETCIPGKFACQATFSMAKLAIVARMSVMATLTFRNRDGELVDVPTVAATRFKNEFGTIFEQAAVGGAVAITKHNTPKAVLLSYAEFEALTKANTPSLDDLSDQFDQLLESMQTPQSKSAMASAFDATPEQLGRAAVKAARAKR
jgi:antitoxin Phd